MHSQWAHREGSLLKAAFKANSCPPRKTRLWTKERRRSFYAPKWLRPPCKHEQRSRTSECRRGGGRVKRSPIVRLNDGVIERWFDIRKTNRKQCHKMGAAEAEQTRLSIYVFIYPRNLKVSTSQRVGGGSKARRPNI